MAYNPAMYNTYGNMYGGSYGQQGNFPAPMQQAAPQQNYAPVVSPGQGLIWVDGEVGAKAYQIPGGWPANTPIALWDTNDTIIYLKSTNQMGMPNPLQKLTYWMEEVSPKYIGQSGTGRLMSGENAQEGQMRSQAGESDLTMYVKKDELERMKQELLQSIQEMQGASGASGTGSNGNSNAGRRTTKGEN